MIPVVPERLAFNQAPSSSEVSLRLYFFSGIFERAVVVNMVEIAFCKLILNERVLFHHFQICYPPFSMFEMNVQLLTK